MFAKSREAVQDEMARQEGRILIAWDKEFLPDHDIRRVLACQGYLVREATDRKEAMELAKNERFDLLLTSALAQDMPTLQVVETIKRNDPAIAVVVVGGHDSVDAILTRFPLEPQGVLVTPYTDSKLTRTVRDALERRRLERQNKRLEALMPIFEASKTLMSEVDLTKLFDVILQIVWAETEADRVSIMLLDEEGEKLTVKAALGLGEEDKRNEEKIGEGIAGWVAKTAQPLMLNYEWEIDPSLKEKMARMGVSSILSLPLVAKGQVIGVLTASTTTGGQSLLSSDLELLSIISGQAAIAIENASLFDKVKTQQLRVEKLLARTILAQEDERRRIMLEIHDGVAQWLVGASYQVQACSTVLSHTRGAKGKAELSEVKMVLDQSIKELRRLIADLRLPALDELGLVGALRRAVEEFETRTNILCHFEMEGTPLSLPPSVEIAAYRVAQEALTNVRRHSQASEVQVQVCFWADSLTVQVSDNGKGFNLQQVSDRAASLEQVGLSGMEERAETVGGTLTIETEEGMGTTVLLRLPSASRASRNSPSVRARVHSGWRS
ncbi:MAG: hypothetical protein A2Y60_04065 [Chloroflexi bacterium RBG_13_54_9]|nr:MAG: hypothetical protein A2Y60_04065 [Chloroflexi bacterium RBG_13_54_9]